MFGEGFHTTQGTQVGIQQMASRFCSLGVKHIAPRHCTDEGAKAALRAVFGRSFVHVGVGRVIRFPFKLGR